MTEIQINGADLRDKVVSAFQRVLGNPLPLYTRRKQIAELGLRGEASLAKDACEKKGTVGQLLPDGFLGGQAVYLTDKLIDYAVSASVTKKGKKPGDATEDLGKACVCRHTGRKGRNPKPDTPVNNHA